MKTVTDKLNRTIKSINAHVGRGGTSHSQRGYDLVDRYNEYKDQAIKEGSWDAYCENNGYDSHHDAHDCFA